MEVLLYVLASSVLILMVIDFIVGPYDVLSRMDHIAMQSEDPNGSAHWYAKMFGGKVMYSDDEWSIVRFKNINLAFVIPENHPAHISFETNRVDDGFKKHRDGSMFKYVVDKWGNTYELIHYNKKG